MNESFYSPLPSAPTELSETLIKMSIKRPALVYSVTTATLKQVASSNSRLSGHTADIPAFYLVTVSSQPPDIKVVNSPSVGLWAKVAIVPNCGFKTSCWQQWIFFVVFNGTSDTCGRAKAQQRRSRMSNFLMDETRFVKEPKPQTGFRLSGLI